MLKPLMHRWERRLFMQEEARRAHAFDWGLEYVGLSAGSVGPLRTLLSYARDIVHEPSEFYADPGRPPLVHETGEGRYRFPSAVRAPEDETNRISVRFFKPRTWTGRAMIVLPQWNAGADSHVRLCELMARRGIAAARLTLPYHEDRGQAGEPRADLAVSANLGRTLMAGRQAVSDVRRTRAWLETIGYERIGLLGTSLGSCIAFLALANDPRFRVAVLHHVSSSFGDVVWRGISTRHVRSALEPHVSQAALRRVWAPISPIHFVHRAPRRAHALLLTGRYDLTFPYDLSEGFHRAFRKHARPHHVVVAPWGHYTSGLFPFVAITTGRVLRYLDARL
ncbi:MAG: alpha/beta hydrolase family protein [Gemmatimonadota bacterium]